MVLVRLSLGFYLSDMTVMVFANRLCQAQQNVAKL